MAVDEGATPDLASGGTRWAQLARARALLERRGWVLPAAAGVSTFLVAAAVLIWANHARPVVNVEVAFDSKACCSFQIWPNGISRGSLTLVGVTPGTNATYSAPIYTPYVNELYITTGSQPQGTARIERIWVSRGGHVVDQVSPAQLRSGSVYDATARPTQTGLVLTSTGAQPAVDLHVLLDSHEGRLRLLLARLITQRQITYAALVLFGALALVLVALRRRAWPVAASLVATILVVRGGPWLSWRLHLHDDVTRAVGYASYVGLWKARERFVLDIAIVAPILVAAATALVLRRRRGRTDPVPATEAIVPDRRLRRRVSIPVVALPIVLVALAAMPNLRLYIGPAPQFVPSWDANNFIFWEYLVRMTHAEPVKDFYWLYGYQWLTDLRAPWGNLITYGWYLSFWAFVAIGSWFTLGRFFRGRSLVARYLLLAAFWVTADLTNDMPFSTRYIAALAALLMFTGIPRGARWLDVRRIMFVIALVDAALFEPAQAMYALGGIAFFAVAEFAVDLWRLPAERRPWLLKTVGTIAAPIVVATVVLAAAGTVGETIALYKELALSSAAYAFPSQVDTWVTTPDTLESVIFWALPVTLVLALVGLVLRRGTGRLAYGVVGALGVLNLMIMQKQILRPHIAGQVWLPLVFGLAFWAVSDTLLAPSRRWSWVLAVGWGAAALVLVSGGYRQAWHEVRGGPGRLSGTVHALVYDRATFAEQARGQFAPSAFARFTEAQPVANALRALPASRRDSLWTLSDDPEIPMMLGIGWHYYFNDLYDASPLDFQKKLLHEFATHPPATVVWNFSPHSMTFDAVPNVVRVPLLFGWAIQHLEPFRTIGDYALLRERTSPAPPDLAWWRRRIGVRTDLGHIPAVVQLPSTSCTGGAECGTFLVVRFAAGAPHPPQVVVPVTIDGVSFEVAFETGPEDEYVVPLNRLWFAEGDPGAPLKVGTVTAGAGSSVSVEHRVLSGSVLY